jgi:hypothetical protein
LQIVINFESDDWIYRTINVVHIRFAQCKLYNKRSGSNAA